MKDNVVEIPKKTFNEHLKFLEFLEPDNDLRISEMCQTKVVNSTR